MAEITQARARLMREHLKELTEAVRHHVVVLDAEMKQPASLARGKRIGSLVSALELVNDMARRFGLGLNWPKS